MIGTFHGPYTKGDIVKIDYKIDCVTLYSPVLKQEIPCDVFRLLYHFFISSIEKEHKEKLIAEVKKMKGLSKIVRLHCLRNILKAETPGEEKPKDYIEESLKILKEWKQEEEDVN